jgi:hypothetical protein
MKALPAALRPNPFTIEENIMEALQRGWNTDDLAKACYINEKHPNPAFVVTNLRNLCKYGPKVETVRTGWQYGHIRCDEPFHEKGCEICRCIPGQVTHHIVAAPTKRSFPAVGNMP